MPDQSGCLMPAEVLAEVGLSDRKVVPVRLGGG